MDYIVKEVVNERLMQRLRFTDQWDDARTYTQWMVLISRHLTAPIGLLGGMMEGTEALRTSLVKVAALTIAAIESIDRRHGKEKDQAIKGSDY